MQKDSPFTSDRCAGFTTKLKGGCEMFQGSLINRLARSVALLVLVAAIGHLTAAGVEVHAAPPPSHEDILTSLEAVQTSVGAVQTSVGAVQTSVGAVQTTVNSIETKLDQIPPAWSQIIPLASDRFSSVLGAFGELDRETGLVWERVLETAPHPTTEQTWRAAMISCNARTVGGRKGWRLPTVQELASLIDPTIATPGPTLPPGHHFSNVQQAFYWSATTDANDTSRAWFVNLYTGLVFNDGVKTVPGHVWCVRGGQGIDGVQ